jgi:hypothetical protein
MPFRLLDEEPEKLETEITPQQTPKIGSFRLLEDEPELTQPSQSTYKYDASRFRPKGLTATKSAQEAPEEQSIFRQVADIPLGIARGGVTGIKMMTDILGADNPVSKSLAGVEGYMADLMSAQAKEDQQEISRIMKDAEDKGFGEQVKAGIKAFSIAPVDIMSQALGTMAPVLATGLAGSAAKLGALGIRAVQTGVGAGMGAGMIKGEIYNEVKNELINSGTPEELAEKAAVDAQSYGGKNLDQILLGAGLGAASTLGAERILTRLITKQGVAPSAGIISRTLKGGFTEAIPEGVQAAQEQLAKNVALQREGFDVDPSRGVVAAATMEAIAGAPLGGLAGAIEQPAKVKTKVKTLEEEKFEQTNEIARNVAENGAPLTASALQDKAAANLNQDELAKKLEEELSISAVKPSVVAPVAIPTKDEYVARYSAIAQVAPEELTRAEQSFTSELATADTEEKRINAQNALDAIKEVKGIRITPAAQPSTPVTQEGQVDSTIFDLQSVANNTATREQISSLSLSGLVDIRKGQAIINEDGEGILAQAQAPLPKLTPEERAAEVEAATPRPLPTDALPTETPGAEYGREAELFDVFGGVRRRPVDVAEPIIGEEPQVSPIVGEQVADTTPVEQVAETQVAEEPIISEKPQTSEIVGAETPAIVEQEQVTPPVEVAPTIAEAAPVEPIALAPETAAVDRYTELSRNPKIGTAKERKALEPTVATTTFKTSRGSTYYILPDGKIRRDKYSGTTSYSDQIAFVSPENAEKIKEIRNEYEEGKNTSVEITPEVIRFRFNEKIAEVPIASQSPQEGLSPFELSGGRYPHLGDPVVSPAPVTEQAAPAEATSVQVAEPTVKISRGENFSMDGEYNVSIGDKKYRIFRDSESKYWYDAGVREDAVTQGKAIQGMPWLGLLSTETRKDAIAELVNKYKKELPTPAVSETITEPAAQPTPTTQPEGIAVGNRIKLGKSPQTYTIEEVIPQTATERDLGEQYYSVKNERTGEVQVVEAMDLKKVGGKRARKIAGDIREQQEAVTPIPEANRYTYEEAVKLVDSYFDKEGIPEGIVIVNNTTDPNLEMKAGYFVDRGQIVINLAYIAKGENLSDIISHELGHFIFSDPQFQADFKAFWDLMTPEEQADADRIINQFYNKETGAIQMEEKQVRAFMQLIQDSKAMPKWRQLLDSIKRWINEKLGTNFLVTDRGALSVLAAAHKRFKSGERIIREIDSGVLKMAAEPRREKVAGKERGEIITTPEGIIKQTNEVLRKKFFDGSEVSDENTSAAWDYIEQLLDTKSGAAYDLAGQINDVVDQETNSDTRMGAGLFSVSLVNYATKLQAQGDNTMISYLVRRTNRMPTDNRGGTATESGRVLRGKREYEIDGYHTITTEHDSKVERTTAALFGTDRPNKDQVKAVEDAINAAEDETIGNPEDVAAEIEKVENRTGRRVVDKVEGKIKESTEPKKEELLISFENLDADKKIKGITLKYNPQKVNVAKNIQNFIIGKMVDYRKTLVNQGAGGLESTFWQTMSNLENKPGPLGELDQAQNNELARIVKNTLIKLGLQGEPDNTKMTDIEKVASILNENKLSDEKRLEADQRIVQEIERRRQSDLASGSSPEAVNAKYDVILDAWNEAMSRQIDMPISDNMLQRLLKSEIKQRNTQIGELINENDGRVAEQVKNEIVDSIIRRVYGVSKEFETGIEMDEDYSNLQSYLKQTINNMYATAIQKKNAAYAKRQAEGSLKNNVDAQAQSIINQLSTELSDVPTFAPQTENKVKVIVQQDLRQNPDMGRKQPWTSQLTAKLIDAGVDETQAQTISELTWRQHEIKKMDRDLKELKTAAEKGSLAVIIDRIKTTPLEKQQEPNWMQGVIREYLVDAGLSGNAADTAARLYESVISERLAEAKQKAFETTLNKSAPWKNYLSRNSSLGKEALRKIQDAIRTGVLDPTQNVESIIAKENGWSGFTKEQFQRIVQLDNVISNPESDEVTKAEAMAELNAIIVKAKIPVRFKDAIGAYYVGQALMGIPTVTVNIASPIGFSVRNLITDIGRYAFTEPSRIPMAFETFLDSMKSWYNQTSYAFRSQIYLNDVVEYLNGQNVLRELFDKGKAQWARGEYANGMANMLVGMTQITGRVLSALDQGSISMLENQNITRYAMEAMKQRNIPQSKRKEIANMILDTRRRTYAENIASGMEKDRAGVLADMAVRNELISALAPEGIDLKDVLTSAINDSLQSVGRNKVINTKGIEAENKRLSDAGMLSYLPIKFLEDIASGASSGNPLMQVFSKMLYGFALVPARVFHTTAWYSPYGFIRLGIDKYKKNKGEESPYAMSLQTDLQYKQRLTESIAGSIVMLGLAALAGSSTDDEEEKKFRIVITGNGPSYSADKQYFDSWNKKWKPYSIHIVMGDTIIPINIGRGGEALFFPIMLAGALDDWNIKKKLNLTKKSPEDLNFAVEALGSAFFALAQRGPYAAFTKPLFDASKEGKITEELVGQAGFFGKTFVPIFGASVARNISDFINDPVDRSSLEGAIYANTPVIGPWMGAKALNALGQPVRADDWGDKLYKLGAPVVFSFPKNTPENELNELILKKGSGPSIPTRSNAQKRFGDVMTDKEFETYVREYGRVVSDKMFKNRKKLENMSVKNYDDELQRYVTGYSIDGIKISGASDMAVSAVKKMRTQ